MWGGGFKELKQDKFFQTAFNAQDGIGGAIETFQFFCDTAVSFLVRLKSDAQITPVFNPI